MGRKQLISLAGFIILLIAIPATMYLVRQTQIFKPKAAFITKIEFVDQLDNPITQTATSSVGLRIVREAASPFPAAIDTLDYFLTDHQDKSLDGEHDTGSLVDFINGHVLSQTMERNKSYYTKWASDVFEIHTWDEDFIYLKEDHSGQPVGFYSFTPGKWLARQMKVGDKLSVLENTIQRYDPVCQPLTSSSFPIEMTLENHLSDYDLGGDLGKQDVIIVKYDSSVGLQTGVFERYYYSKEWGWVRWEEYDKASGNLRNRRTFNKITQTKIEPTKEVACSR